MRMDKYGRELDLILLLTDNANYTTQQLADRLGITRRNVYYYLDYLRDCGFNLIKSGTCYRLDRSSSFFRRLHENIALSEAEADYICRKLDFTDSKDYTAQSVRQKLTRTFNLPNPTNPDLQRRVNASITKLKEAMATRQMVMLHDYSSPHSHTVSDRIVEPYLFMNDCRDIRCHEIRSHINKTFKLSRTGWVEILDVPWAFEDRHKEIYTDIFMFSGETRHRIDLRLGQLSHNLLIEEYPQSEDCISSDGEDKWLFSADVVSFLGIGRFVIGLYDDIEILGCEEFKEYVRDKIKGMLGRKVIC